MCMYFLFSDDEFSATALLVRGGENKKYIHRRQKILCVRKNKIYAPETVLFHSSAVDTACDIVVY